eukprot:2105289-Rhodomonas_salina.2
MRSPATPESNTNTCATIANSVLLHSLLDRGLRRRAKIPSLPALPMIQQAAEASTLDQAGLHIMAHSRIVSEGHLIG